MRKEVGTIVVEVVGSPRGVLVPERRVVGKVDVSDGGGNGDVERIVGVGGSGENWKDGAMKGGEDGGGRGDVGTAGEAEGFVGNTGLAFLSAMFVGEVAGNVQVAVAEGVLGKAKMGADEVGLEAGTGVEGVAAGSAGAGGMSEVLSGGAAVVTSNEVASKGGGIGGVVGATVAVIGNGDGWIRAVGGEGGVGVDLADGKEGAVAGGLKEGGPTARRGGRVEEPMVDIERIASIVRSGGEGLKPGDVVEGVGKEVVAGANLEVNLALGLGEVNGIEEGDEVGWGMAKAREVPEASEAHGDAKVTIVGVGGDGGDGNQVGRGGGVGDGELLG